MERSGDVGIPTSPTDYLDLGDRPHQTGRTGVNYRTTLIVASLAAMFLWYWPIGRMLISPVTILNTFIHEYMHALAAWASDGSVSHIVVYANASGVTHISGGQIWLIAPAGYVGSSVMGALLLVLSHRERLVRWLLGFFAASVALGMIVLVRGEALAVAVGITSVVAIFAGAKWLPTGGVVFLAQFVAIQQCAASFQAFYWLFKATEGHGMPSDAMRMAQATGLPAELWAALWCAFSAALVYFAIRYTWRSAGREGPRRRSRT